MRKPWGACAVARAPENGVCKFTSGFAGMMIMHGVAPLANDPDLTVRAAADPVCTIPVKNAGTERRVLLTRQSAQAILNNVGGRFAAWQSLFTD